MPRTYADTIERKFVENPESLTVQRQNHSRAVNSMLRDLWGSDNFELFNDNSMLVREEDGTKLIGHNGMMGERNHGRLGAASPEESIFNFFHYDDNGQLRTQPDPNKKLQILVPSEDGKSATPHYLTLNNKNQYEVSDEAVPKPAVGPKPGLWTRFLSFFGVSSARQAVNDYNAQKEKADAYDAFVGQPSKIVNDAKKKAQEADNQKKAEEEQKKAQAQKQKEAEKEQAQKAEEAKKAEAEQKKAQEKAAYDKMGPWERIQKQANEHPEDVYANHVKNVIEEAYPEAKTNPTMKNRMISAGAQALESMNNVRRDGVKNVSMEISSNYNNMSHIIAFDMMAKSGKMDLDEKTLAAGIFSSATFHKSVKEMSIMQIKEFAGGDGSYFSSQYKAMSKDRVSHALPDVPEAQQKAPEIKAKEIKAPSMGGLHN